MDVGGVTKIAVTTDQRTPICCALLHREIPPPAIFDHFDVNNWVQKALLASNKLTTRADLRVG